MPTCLILGSFAVPADAAFMIQFLEGTWDHSSVGGPSASTGWAIDTRDGGTAGYTQGVQEVEPGVFATVTTSVLGGAIPSPLNFTSGNANTAGFVVSNFSDDDRNGDELLAYQRFDVAFSTPVTMESLSIGDIDSISGSGDQNWNDAIALELWTDAVPASPGLGIVPDIVPGTNLQRDDTTYPIPFVTASNLGNMVNDPDSAVTYSSPAVIDGFSFYLWNTGTGDPTSRHAVTLSAAGAVFETVPEPGAATLLGLAGFALVVRRTRRA